jgi:hypothetical protein
LNNITRDFGNLESRCDETKSVSLEHGVNSWLSWESHILASKVRRLDGCLPNRKLHGLRDEKKLHATGERPSPDGRYWRQKPKRPPKPIGATDATVILDIIHSVTYTEQCHSQTIVCTGQTNRIRQTWLDTTACEDIRSTFRFLPASCWNISADVMGKRAGKPTSSSGCSLIPPPPLPSSRGHASRRD